MSYEVTEVLQMANKGYCSNRLFAELIIERSDYDACITECKGHDKKCIAYNSLACMPIVEVTQRYNLLEQKIVEETLK